MVKDVQRWNLKAFSRLFFSYKFQHDRFRFPSWRQYYFKQRESCKMKWQTSKLTELYLCFIEAPIDDLGREIISIRFGSKIVLFGESGSTSLIFFLSFPQKNLFSTSHAVSTVSGKKHKVRSACKQNDDSPL